jgi:phenylpropionate dioxygenase-like ring-hydroxylating dioxygenase large terminal subunit
LLLFLFIVSLEELVKPTQLDNDVGKRSDDTEHLFAVNERLRLAHARHANIVAMMPSGGKMAETTTPWNWYRDPAVLAREDEAIFRRAWHYVGRLGEPGDVVPGWAGQVPVLLVKSEDGEERAFVNVCRHRGSVVVEEPGNRKTLQCPYHAWTYNLDGSLRAAPRSDREDVDLSDASLEPVRLEGWGPFRFVNLDADAPPLAELLGDVPDRIAAAGLDVDELVFHHRTDWEVAANWKIACENFLECYHCPVAHAGFSGLVDVSPDNYQLQAGDWHWSQFGQLRSRGDADLPVGQFHFIWPNTGINIFPGRPNLSIGPILPLAPDRTRRVLDYFFAADATREWIAEFLEFDDQVGREDARLVELVQRGAGSGVIPEGRLLPESERLVAGFQARVREALAD